MEFIFFGATTVAADTLEQLIAKNMKPVAVVANPTEPVGHKQTSTLPAVKLVADKNDIPVLQPESLTSAEFIDSLQKFNADVFIVMTQGESIPENIITLPRMGTIGVHPSLLPAYRGPSPIQSAVFQGETVSGVTLYKMDTEVDHGPILAVQEFPIAVGASAQSLEPLVASVSAVLISNTIPAFLDGRITPKAQKEGLARNMTKKWLAADGEVDFKNDNPVYIYRKILALNPEPGVWTNNYPGYEGKKVKLLNCEMQNGALKITEIQPDGKE